MAFNGSVAIRLPAQGSTGAYCTGGTVTTVGRRRIHTFLGSGTLQVILPGSVDYLVVAGGGNGGTSGAWHGGGGGAGGMLTGVLAVGVGPTTVTVGGSGVNSALGAVAATAGGAGGNYIGNGAVGGSGGGGSEGGTGAAGTAGQGYAGADGGAGNGGGGGGAGGAGNPGGGPPWGTGGVGASSSISGAPVTYATGGTGGAGFVGAGAANTGNGGDYGGHAGGSGIVIVSYDEPSLTQSQLTLDPRPMPGMFGWRKITASERAEGGYYRATVEMTGHLSVLSEFMLNGLQKEIRIYSGRNANGVQVWEGFIYEMVLNLRTAEMKVSLDRVANNVLARYRITGSSTTVRSTAYVDATSQMLYGNRDFVLSCGELESAAVANNKCQQYLALNKRAKPTRSGPGRADDEYVLTLNCRGYWDTLNNQCFNATVAGAQNASLEVAAIILSKGQFVSSTLISTNTTQVSKVYDVDRRAGDILQDIARLGDSSQNRWLCRMMDDRTFIYAAAASPSTANANAIAYIDDIVSEERRIRDTNGNHLMPWEVHADRWIKYLGWGPPTSERYASLVDDPTCAYIEEASWSSDSDVAQTTTSRMDLGDIVIARASGQSGA